MRAVLVLSIFFFVVAAPTGAQETAAQVVQVSPAGRELPDAPTPKIEPDLTAFNPAASEENSPCPAGVGKACAMLGGQAYYPDLWHMTEHDKTWHAAMKSPPILAMSLVLVGTTAADIEGTDYCLHLNECRELNPFLPKHVNRAWQYSLAMAGDAFGIYFMARLKQHGRGNIAVMILSAASAMHLFIALDSFTVSQPPPASAARISKHK